MRKEIPILYSTAMAQAKLAGRKTQTRRMSGLDLVNACPGDWEYIRYWNECVKFCEKHNHPNELHIRCPYGQPGDLLWGRESYRKYYVTEPGGGFDYSKEPVLEYKADGGEMIYENDDDGFHVFNKDGTEKFISWKPSIHMPKEAARIWDEVTGIRVERVADIIEDDCRAEGIEPHPAGYYKNYLNEERATPYMSYRSLWQLINGKPKPIQSKKGGKLITTGYEVYPFDEQAAAEFQGITTWKGKPLTVITNPWVWVIESKQLSVTGKPAVPAAGKE